MERILKTEKNKTMFQLLKNKKQKKAESLSRQIVTLNKSIYDCEVCIQDAIIFHDVNGKVMHQDIKRNLLENREELIVKLRNI